MTLGRAGIALLCGALVALPGCGSDKKGTPIPADQANRMIKAVQAADQYSADGRCTRAHTKVRDAKFLLSHVPSSVHADVRNGIEDGLTHMDELISSECKPPASTNTQTTPSQTVTTQTQTETQTTSTPTTSTPTTTTPTSTTLTTTTPTTTSPTNTGTSTTTTGNGGTPPGADAGNQG